MEKVIESVGLTLHSVNGQMKEIPLELWQVDIICQILGLTVRVPDLDDYEMSPEDRVIERMEIYNNAIKDMISQNREKEK
ncbi:MAG: hypothetical protein K2O97_05915 [Acetatifactor sp.]|nr:hypothetical protein [Acetatifactor sp.]MDE7044541.1 hypothetical protein [Acetatifactor sp.]